MNPPPVIAFAFWLGILYALIAIFTGAWALFLLVAVLVAPALLIVAAQLGIIPNSKDSK